MIQGLAKLLRQQTRAADVCCRYGGEEFVIIMPDTSPEDAVIVCERVRAEMESMIWPRHPKRQVTLSCGIAGVCGESTPDKDAWLEAADKALYTSKQSGRNKITHQTLDSAPLRQAG